MKWLKFLVWLSIIAAALFSGVYLRGYHESFLEAGAQFSRLASELALINSRLPAILLEHSARSRQEYTLVFTGDIMLARGVDYYIRKNNNDFTYPQIEQYHGSWIAYSLGNFVFDQNFSAATKNGLLLKVTVKNQKISAIAPIELKFTKVIDGDLVKVLSCYDNEYGYVVTLVKHVLNVAALV